VGQTTRRWRNSSMTRKNTGFTLVEILIVVIILGILAAIVIPQFTEASNDARVSAVVSDLQTVRSQIELFKVQHLDQYPGSVNGAAIPSGAALVAAMTSKTNNTGAIDAAGTAESRSSTITNAREYPSAASSSSPERETWW
jgi:prepilin-type N-terminal cleavage/methylation domain-containing protein